MTQTPVPDPSKADGKPVSGLIYASYGGHINFLDSAGPLSMLTDVYGSRMLPANFFQPGRILEIDALLHEISGSGGAYTFSALFHGISVGDATFVDSGTESILNAHYKIVCVAPGTLVCHLDYTTSFSDQLSIGTVSNVSIDTTKAITMDFVGSFGTTADNSASMLLFTVKE